MTVKDLGNRMEISTFITLDGFTLLAENLLTGKYNDEKVKCEIGLVVIVEMVLFTEMSYLIEDTK